MKKKQNNVKYIFKNEIKEDSVILTLSGVVGKPSIFQPETINAEDVRNALSDVGEKDIVVRLNSPGGDAFEGIEICNYFKALQSNITVEVTALAASAASIICMGANKVVMATGSSMMIHEAMTIAIGNKSEIDKVMNALKTIDDSLADIYVNKTGKSKEEIEDLMKAETWFTAKEAVELGFANSVSDEVKNIKAQESDKEASLRNEINELKNEVSNLKNSYKVKNIKSKNKTKRYF